MKQISCLSKSSGEEWSGREKEVNRCSFLPQGRRRKKEDFKVTHQPPSCEVVVCFCFPDVRTPCENTMTTYIPGRPCGSRRRRKKEDFKVTHQAPLVTLSCVFVVALQRSFVFRTYGHHVRIYNDQ